MNGQPAVGDVGLADPGAADGHSPSPHPELHVVARQVLDGEPVADVLGQGLARDDVVEEDSLDGLGVRSRRQAADEGGEGAVGGGEDGEIGAAARVQGRDEARALNEGEQRVEFQTPESILEAAHAPAPPLLTSAATSVVPVSVPVAVAARAPLAVAAPAAGPGSGHGNDAEEEDCHLELHGCEVERSSELKVAISSELKFASSSEFRLGLGNQEGQSHGFYTCQL